MFPLGVTRPTVGGVAEAEALLAAAEPGRSAKTVRACARGSSAAHLIATEGCFDARTAIPSQPAEAAVPKTACTGSISVGILEPASRPLRATLRVRRISGVTHRRLSLLAVVLALAILPAVAGCGGDEESSSEQWAGDVCSQLSTWVTDVEEAIRSLTANALSLDKAAVQAAVEDVKGATDELVDSLADLGPPETESGEQAKSDLDGLGTQLQQQLDEVEQEAEAGSLSLVTVTSALATASSAVKSTYESIQSLDSGDELRNAFEDAESCDSFREQVDTIGN